MISDELKDIIAKLNEQGKMNFLEGATEKQIAEFENVHKIAFPKKFREWLQYSDGGDCFLPAGVQLYGVAHKPLIDVQCNDRPNDNCVVIGALDTGDPVLFKRESEEVSIYNQEAGVIEDDEIYGNFFAFLEDLNSLLGIEG